MKIHETIDDESQEIALSHYILALVFTEALKGHRVVWKIEICYLIRMT